jgi:adenylate cyclase
MLSITILLFLSTYGYFLTRAAFVYGDSKTAATVLYSIKGKVSKLETATQLKAYLDTMPDSKDIFMLNSKGAYLSGKPERMPEDVDMAGILQDNTKDGVLLANEAHTILNLLPLDDHFSGLYIGMVHPLDPVANKRLKNMTVVLIIIGSFFFLFSVGISYYIATGISMTVKDIETRTRKIADDQDIRYKEIAVVSLDEIGDLTRAFNDLQNKICMQAGQLKNMLQQYLSPGVADWLIQNPERVKPGGERRVMTVLFSDIKGFTPFSEKNSSEDVVQILNEFFSEMADIVHYWDGTLDNIVGDEIVAFWGAPKPQKNHAELAIRCALNMASRLDELRRKRLSEGRYFFDIGIGINTGEMVAGNIGAEGKKMHYTVIGDEVNIASRVERLTRKFETNILITESAYRCLEDLRFPDDGNKSRFGHVQLREFAPVQVKGKETPITLYDLADTEMTKWKS